MRKLLAMVASLMLVLTLVSGLQVAPALAYDGMTCSSTIVDEAAPGHSAGDADEVPADSDKATPHHHNISHSHEIAVPATELGALDYRPSLLPAGATVKAPPASAETYRDLRPPIA